MSELSDYKRLVESPAIRSCEATINSLRAEVEKLKAENERLTNKVQSQHDHMAPKYDAAMAEIEKLKAERDEWKSSAADMGRQGIKLMAEITRLTSQLEQAERVIKPFADVSDTLHSGYDAGMAAGDKPTARVSVSDLRAASQWIKDRQAKGEAS